MVHATWVVVTGSRLMHHGPVVMHHGPRIADRLSQIMDLGSWSMGCGYCTVNVGARMVVPVCWTLELAPATHARVPLVCT